MPSSVSIVKCESYNPQEVEAAVSRCLEFIGRIEKFIRPGTKVLLKPNMLSGVDPAKAVTTHPAIVEAIAKEVIKAGAKPFIGDCFGDANAGSEETFKKTGLKEVAEKLGIDIVNLGSGGIVEIRTGKIMIDPLYVSRIAYEADAVINIPKLKTHELCLFTCAIKNMFGIIPGSRKTNLHLLTPKPSDFADTLVEIFKTKIPVLNIVDAVIGMEGNGPGNGDPRKIGHVIASSDAVAIDSVCSKIISFEPNEIDTTRIANKKGLGEMDLDKIEILGEKLTVIMDFKKTYGSYKRLQGLPDFLIKVIGPILEIIKVRPIINGEKCLKCMVCVNNCPAKAIDGSTFKIDGKKCIMCFCCRELCKYNAVDLKQGILLKILRMMRR